MNTFLADVDLGACRNNLHNDHRGRSPVSSLRCLQDNTGQKTPKHAPW